MIYTDDLSFQAVASQSPLYPSQSAYYLYRASNALDRNANTCMRTDDIGINAPYETVWWKVDLGVVCNIYSINILFKNYDGKGICVFLCTVIWQSVIEHVGNLSHPTGGFKPFVLNYFLKR